MSMRNPVQVNRGPARPNLVAVGLPRPAVDQSRRASGRSGAFRKRRASVADLMTQPAITICWADSVAAAARVMRAHGIRHLPVVEPDGRLIGILAEGDVRAALASEGAGNAAEPSPALIVGGAMSTEPVSVRPDTTLSAAVHLMDEHELSALPVVDRDAVVGTVTESDILRALPQVVDIDGAERP